MKTHPKMGLIIFWISLLFSTLIFADITNTSQDKLIRTTIQQLMKKNKINGIAVILYANGKIQTYYFGEANPQKHIPVSENTLFELGSITKTFTTLLLAENILEHKMQLKDTIKINNHSSKITLQELATHTSSLPFNALGLPYNASITQKNKVKLNHFLEKWTPPYLPGSKMLYSNLGFSMLGIILSKNMQTTLPTLMKQKILIPLGMNNSGLDISPTDQRNIAIGFSQNEKSVAHLPSGLLAGSWAMKSSAKDMQKYLKLALLLPTTSKKMQQAMRLSQTGFYSMTQQGTMLGLGWTITSLENPSNTHNLISNPAHYNFSAYSVRPIKNPTYNPNALIAKIGATDGFRSYIAIIPNKQTGIVILANKYFGSGDMLNVANKILFQISGIKI